MALIVCLKCDKCYPESLSHCRHCNTPNFFCDPDGEVMLSAVRVLIEQTEADHEANRQKKLDEIEQLRPQRRIVRRILRGFRKAVKLIFLPLLSKGNRPSGR